MLQTEKGKTVMDETEYVRRCSKLIKTKASFRGDILRQPHTFGTSEKRAKKGGGPP